MMPTNTNISKILIYAIITDTCVTYICNRRFLILIVVQCILEISSIITTRMECNYTRSNDTRVSNHQWTRDATYNSNSSSIPALKNPASRGAEVPLFHMSLHWSPPWGVLRLFVPTLIITVSLLPFKYLCLTIAIVLVIGVYNPFLKTLFS